MTVRKGGPRGWLMCTRMDCAREKDKNSADGLCKRCRRERDRVGKARGRVR